MQLILVGRRIALPVLLTLVLLLTVFVPGCTRTVPPSYTLADETKKLPANHQTQIQQSLARFFGDPHAPRLKVPTEETDETGESRFVDQIPPERLQRGAKVFQRNCAGCHGVTGDGQGEAAKYLQPRPRDYRRGIYKFTSTPYGARPHRNDLLRVIVRGVKGTSMPSFRYLPDEDLQAVVDYVIMLSYRGEVERQIGIIAASDYAEDEQIESADFADAIAEVHAAWTQAQDEITAPLTAAPKMTDETILAGRKAFLSRGCSKCHGEDARGQTQWLSLEFLAEQQNNPNAEQINYDVWEQPAPAADLTAGMLHGGRRPIDIYRRIRNGINGTPMPSFELELSAEPETMWHLVHYVLAVVEHRHVEGLDEVVAEPPQSDSAPEQVEENE